MPIDPSIYLTAFFTGALIVVTAGAFLFLGSMVTLDKASLRSVVALAALEANFLMLLAAAEVVEELAGREDDVALPERISIALARVTLPLPLSLFKTLWIALVWAAE